jgi:hypothetical protein
MLINMMLKVDMHVHTSCSPDSLIKVDDLLETCDRSGIDCVAVTDHDTADCAPKLHEQEPSRIIVGEEIHTTDGEITGLFLKETIPPGLSPMKTVERIKQQGGLVYLPHPFDRMRGSVLQQSAIDKIWKEIDIIEAFNSRNVLRWSNRRASSFARKRSIITGAGSDAHARYEVGNAYVLIERFNSATDFLEKLADAEIRSHKTSLLLNFMTKMYKVARGIR